MWPTGQQGQHRPLVHFVARPEHIESTVVWATADKRALKTVAQALSQASTNYLPFGLSSLLSE